MYTVCKQKEKEKEKNCAIDRALKDRTKRKRKAVGAVSGKQVKEVEATLLDDEESGLDDAREGTKGGPSREELEERMTCAMMEAEGESRSEEDDEELAGSRDEEEMDDEDEDERAAPRVA